MKAKVAPPCRLKKTLQEPSPVVITLILGQVIQTVPQTAGALYTSLATGGGKALPFLWSLGQSFGGAYGQARDEGIDANTARKAALLQAIPEAAIEVSGGVENLLGKSAGKGFLKTVGRAALEEGLEEVFQYPFEGLAKKLTYAPETPIASLKEQAIINPLQMGQNALVGGIAGGLFGGETNVMTNCVRLPIPKQQTHQTPIQAEQQTRTMPIPKKPDFYTDTYGNTATDINASRTAPQTPLMLPAAKNVEAQPQTTAQAEGLFVEYYPERRAADVITSNEFQSVTIEGGLKPDEIVTIYRGAPKSQKYINNGDWVTTNEQLAKDYAGSGHVIKDRVQAQYLYAPKGEGIEELIYSTNKKTIAPLHKAPYAPEIFSPNRITPADLAALNRRGLNPEVQKLSDRLNPPIQKPVEPILKPTQQAQQAQQQAAPTAQPLSERIMENPYLTEEEKKFYAEIIEDSKNLNETEDLEAREKLIQQSVAEITGKQTKRQAPIQAEQRQHRR